jgi:hypothetical protein
VYKEKRKDTESQLKHNFMSLCFSFFPYTPTQFFLSINLDVGNTSPKGSHMAVIRASQAICCVDTATNRRHLAIGVGAIINKT